MGAVYLKIGAFTIIAYIYVLYLNTKNVILQEIMFEEKALESLVMCLAA